MELRANPNRLALGSVIEARLDKSKRSGRRRCWCTNGTLQERYVRCSGYLLGQNPADDRLSRARTIKKAGPATAVEILGLSDVPEAGDEFNAVKEDKVAKRDRGKQKDRSSEKRCCARNASTTLEQLSLARYRRAKSRTSTSSSRAM